MIPCMYGRRDIYGSPFAARPHRVSRAPMGIERLAEEVSDEVVLEMFGGRSGLKKAGDWAKGVVDPSARLKNWKATLKELAAKWKGLDKKGDSESDKIANKMIELAKKIRDRQADWTPSPGIVAILLKYKEGRAIGFKKKASSRDEEATEAAERLSDEDDEDEDTDEVEGSELQRLKNEAAEKARDLESADDRDEAADELLLIVEKILEIDPEWDAPYSVTSVVEKL